MPREEESLTFMTPTPQSLSSGNGVPKLEGIVAARTVIVGSVIGRTHSLGRVQREKEALAFLTPAPATLGSGNSVAE
jgi:hypothetical protein